MIIVSKLLLQYKQLIEKKQLMKAIAIHYLEKQLQKLLVQINDLVSEFKYLSGDIFDGQSSDAERQNQTLVLNDACI